MKKNEKNFWDMEIIGNRRKIEVLLLSCYSLKHLELQDLCLTPEMAGSICKNGKKLQILNLNH